MDSTATAGQIQFPRTLSEEVHGGPNLMGYRMGDGRSLLYFHAYRDKPTIYLVSDEDARIVQARWRHIQMEIFADNIPQQEEKDLWKGITLLPMLADPIEWWPGEQEARDAQVAYRKWREENPEATWAAVKDQWKLGEECELAADMAKNPDKYSVA